MSCRAPRPPMVGRASDLPNPHTWAIHLARGAMELLVGRRTGPQLSGWATGQAISEFTEGAPNVADPGRVRTARVTAVGPARVEAVVLIDFGERTRAMAIRLVGVNMPVRPYQRHRPGPRWMATSLRLL